MRNDALLFFATHKGAVVLHVAAVKDLLLQTLVLTDQVSDVLLEVRKLAACDLLRISHFLQQLGSS